MRTLTAVQSGHVAGPVTKPQYLVEITLDQTYYLSTRVDVGWDSQTWVADGSVEVDSASPDGATIRIDNLDFAHTTNALSGVYAGNALKIWQGYSTDDVPYIDPDYWDEYTLSGSVLAPIKIFDGVIYSFPVIDYRMSVSARRLPPKRYPFTRIRPPIANHLPGDGYVVTFDSDTLKVEGEDVR